MKKNNLMMFGRVRMFVLMLILSVGAQAQQMTARTNEVALNFKQTNTASGQLPMIRWVTPALDFTTTQQNKVAVSFSVKTNSNLKDVRLRVVSAKDGQEIGKKVFTVKPGERTYDLNATVTLPDGNNNLIIEAINEQGALVSDRRQVLVGKDAANDMVSLDRKDYVLLFATDKYDHWDDLVNPVNDARTIAKELKERYGFIVEIVENPELDEIWSKLREYNERKFTPQDQLMIFFAGHGHYDETFGEGYVVAKNSLNNDLTRNSYLSHNRLRGVVNNIGCNHILLTMDVCFGGTLDPVIAASRSLKENEVSVNQMLVRKWSHRTRKYLTSGGKEYVSDGIADRHSPFAGKLIESFRNMGGEDRVLTLSELQSNLEKLSQLPRSGSFGNDEPLSDFIFVGKRTAP